MVILIEIYRGLNFENSILSAFAHVHTFSFFFFCFIIHKFYSIFKQMQLKTAVIATVVIRYIFLFSFTSNKNSLVVSNNYGFISVFFVEIIQFVGCLLFLYKTMNYLFVYTTCSVGLTNWWIVSQVRSKKMILNSALSVNSGLCNIVCIQCVACFRCYYYCFYYYYYLLCIYFVLFSICFHYKISSMSIDLYRSIRCVCMYVFVFFCSEISIVFPH